jgi:hypothetical protein
MNPYLRISLVFGTIAGLAGALYFVVLQYWINDPALGKMSSLEILITLICSVYAMGYYRDRKQGGVLHFWQGAVIGLETAFVSTFITCLVVYWIVRLVDPSVFREFILLTQKDMSGKLTSEAVRKTPALQQMIRSQLASLPDITPFNMIFFPGGIFVKNFAIEFLLTGMIAAIMRKNVSHLSKGNETTAANNK